MPVLVFDMGGTLMEYKGMPHSWADYYVRGFEKIAEDFECKVTPGQIERSAEIMKEFNPRIQYREIEYEPEYIFGEALKGWNTSLCLKDAVLSFFGGLALEAEIYLDTIPVLAQLRERGDTICVLTDLPSAMPDELFRKDIANVLPYIDFYVSSQTCGYRKPNKNGLMKIAEQYKIAVDKLLYIGDEEKDRKTAENAGCRFIRIDRTGKEGLADITNLDDLFLYL